MLRGQKRVGRSLCAGLTCCLSLPQLLNPPTKMSCQQNQQQCQPPFKCVPKCPTPKCPPNAPQSPPAAAPAPGAAVAPAPGAAAALGVGAAA